MDVGLIAWFAAVALVPYALGVVIRRWWLVALCALPSAACLAVTLPAWSEPESNSGANGADWFAVGILVIGVPLILGAGAGVAVGRARAGRRAAAAPPR